MVRTQLSAHTRGSGVFFRPQKLVFVVELDPGGLKKTPDPYALNPTGLGKVR